MTSPSLADLRSRLYGAYTSRHAGGSGGEAGALVNRRAIRSLLPRSATGLVVGLRCGRGELARLLEADSFDAEGIDISPERPALARAVGVARVRQGDFRAGLAGPPAHHTAITATDLPEHLTKPRVLRAFDCVAAALAPCGVLVTRVPKAASPLGGHIHNGDFTSQTSFAARSIRRLAAAPGFESVVSRSSPSVARGLAYVWYPVALAKQREMLRGHVVKQDFTFAASNGVGLVKLTNGNPA